MARSGERDTVEGVAAAAAIHRVRRGHEADGIHVAARTAVVAAARGRRHTARLGAGEQRWEQRARGLSWAPALGDFLLARCAKEKERLELGAPAMERRGGHAMDGRSRGRRRRAYCSGEARRGTGLHPRKGGAARQGSSGRRTPWLLVGAPAKEEPHCAWAPVGQREGHDH